MNTITVKAVPRDGYPGFWAAGRLFPGGRPIVLEVDESIERALDEHGNVDARRIGRTELAEISAPHRQQWLTVVSGGDLAAEESPSEADAVASQFAKLAAENANLHAALAELRKEVDALRQGRAGRQQPREG